MYYKKHYSNSYTHIVLYLTLNKPIRPRKIK